MMMSPGLRKFAITVHVTTSVGWLGAVVAFLALAVAGLASHNPRFAAAAYPAMSLTTWFVIVPLSFISLLSGVVQALGTTWGLFRHYWVLIKLLITAVATLVLLVHTQPIDHMARAATESTLAMADLVRTRVQLVVDAALALVILVVATTLSMYKPKGLTKYGHRKVAGAAPGAQ